jgi:uncharacterized protein
LKCITKKFPDMDAATRNLRVWTLLDGRAGNDGQSLGLAQALGLDFERVPVAYNAWARLPNMLRGASLVGVDAQSTAKLIAPFPDVVIAAGRRLAPVARYIKRQHPHTFLIHLMHPDTALDGFDVVVMPQHDHPPQRETIITTIGALHGVRHEGQSGVAIELKRVAVLVGGGTKHGAFDIEDAMLFIAQLKVLAANGCVLDITTSRRTPQATIDALRAAFGAAPHRLYMYGSDAPNPYPAMLYPAAQVVVTGDSVAMCCEACALGKPVYIFTPQSAMARKHKELIGALVAQGYARLLSSWDAQWQGGEVLQEAQRIAPLIHDRLARHLHQPL